ncbi:MAG: exodeoxyribonuclease III [Gammaproteobacteria bacterium AqS3]|nr:exodeoxyribonuclease III [Gammaproteobacteria bacterium AqS3]
MKIITWNVNGIRAIERKGELQTLVEAERPDVLMLQEIKGNRDQFSAFLTEHEGFFQEYHSAEKKGYSGTGIWLDKSFADGLEGVQFCNSADIKKLPNADEGRVLQLDFQRGGRGHSLLCIYFPNGGKSELAWQQKLEFYDAIHAHINRLRAGGARVVLGGDLNVAHTEIDLARPGPNDGKIGFHPDERAWMDRLHADGWVDCWRARNPGVTEVYSYWDMQSRARDRNIGWRIDYFVMDSDELNAVGEIEYLNTQLGSDHCPLRMQLD